MALYSILCHTYNVIEKLYSMEGVNKLAAVHKINRATSHTIIPYLMHLRTARHTFINECHSAKNLDLSDLSPLSDTVPNLADI